MKHKMVTIQVEAQAGVTNANLKSLFMCDRWHLCRLVHPVQVQVNDVTPKRKRANK